MQGFSGLDHLLSKLISDLVSFDTTSRKSNLELIEYVRSYLGDYGVESRLIYDDSRTKANLYATIGPDDVPGLMLSGHTDIVPVDGQPWSKNPFKITFEKGLLFGRGTADMKGFIACVLARVPDLIVKALTTPVHIALSYDEEVGCIGVRRLLEVMQSMKVRPAMGIIGEPTNMQVITAHKGKKSWRVHVRGLAAHSAYPLEGVNAVEMASELISQIRKIHQRVALEGPFDEGYRVPHTTLHIGPIQGGTALNIVPETCDFQFEVRHLPELTAEALFEEIYSYSVSELQPFMRDISPNAVIEFETLSDYPGLSTCHQEAVVGFVQSLMEEQTQTGKISFGSEAGLFGNETGIPCVVCGPGSILQAHRTDEFISIDQLELCWKFLGRVVENLRSHRLPT